ncbi:chemosensory protein 13 [Aphomia sociella]
MLAVIVFCLIGAAMAQEKYDSIEENFNISELIGNERLIQAYSRCLLNKGPCTPDVKQLKDKIPEVLETKCAKCTEKQKQSGKQLIKEIKKSHPEIWKQLVSKYDPSGKYQQSFQEFLNS